jgi:hypothetical protein
MAAILGFCFQTEPEKVLRFVLAAGVPVIFSATHLSSPVSWTPSGESNAIINRSFGEARLTCEKHTSNS